MGKFFEGCYDDLSVYVRYAAYLDATPERPKDDKSDAPRLTRREERRKAWAAKKKGRREEDYAPMTPDLDGLDYLIAYLYEIGPTLSGGMGPAPITQGEIRAWQKNTGIRLQPWEARFLRRLSVEYLNELHRAQTLGCRPPWIAPGFKPEPTATQLSLRALAKP